MANIIYFGLNRKVKYGYFTSKNVESTHWTLLKRGMKLSLSEDISMSLLEGDYLKNLHGELVTETYVTESWYRDEIRKDRDLASKSAIK